MAINEKIHSMVTEILQKQEGNGSWNFCFEGTIMTDAYMIILIRVLQIKNEEDLVKELAKRIRSKQHKDNGAWKVFADEKEGNLDATIEGYFSLLYSGHVKPGDPLMQKAERFIRNRGGLTRSGWLTRVMLALTGQTTWPKVVKSVPIEIMLLPKNSPISLYQLVGYARAHWIPIIICSNKNASFTTPQTPNISSLQSRSFETENSGETRIIQEYVKSFVAKVADAPEALRKMSFEKAEAYITNRIEANGTLYSYFSASFFMVFAFLALGYDRTHPYISNAVNGMKSYVYKDEKMIHVQNSPSTVWDTALLTGALMHAGVPKTNPVIQRAGSYLLSRQHSRYGDWAFKNQHVEPGGWGFSDSNSTVPDVDDTTAALRVITPFATDDTRYKESWNKGVDWLLSMQNNDGGWSAFEKNTDNFLLSLIPFKYEDRVLFDASTPDLTGRSLYFLGENTTMPHDSSVILRAKEWLVQNQERDGSWYGRWGICYIYGTWAAVTGLVSIGETLRSQVLQKAVQWLYQIQNKDGGWGESCSSDWEKKYIPLESSTPSQTAWALDALIAVSDVPTPEMEKGVATLLQLLESGDWRTDYPTGAGIPGSYYVHYHSYHYIWPLQTLSNYRNKYDNN